MVLAIRLATTTQDNSSTWPSEAAIAGSAVATTVPSAAERNTGRTIGGKTARNSVRRGGLACATAAAWSECSVICLAGYGPCGLSIIARWIDQSQGRAQGAGGKHD